MFKYLEYETDAKNYAAQRLNEKGMGQMSKLWWKFGFPYLPVIVYCLIVLLLTKLYRWFADRLTEWGK